MPTGEKFIFVEEEENNISFIILLIILIFFNFSYKKKKKKKKGIFENKKIFAHGRKEGRGEEDFDYKSLIAYFHFSPQKKKNWNFREQKNFRPRTKNLFTRKRRKKTSIINRSLIVAYFFFLKRKRKRRKKL